MPFNEVIVLPSLLEKLKRGGYENMDQLVAKKSTELKAELNLEYEEVKQLIEARNLAKGIVKTTLGASLEAEKKYSFTTSSKKLDNMLLTGIPPTKITEICGESGSGKTQICMQLAHNVQLPRKLGGAGGECIYIDTEGSFLTSRLIEIAKAHDVDSTLKGIHLFRVLDHTELIALIRQLRDIVQSYPKVKLIIIDSLAYHFRLNVLDAKSRGAILDFIARTLLEIAKRFELAVVITNHVTQAGDDAPWTPSLGGTWTYWLFNRIFIYRKRHFRFAYLYKAAGNVQDKPVQFCVKDEGIADPEEDELEVEKNETETQAEIDNKIDASWAELKEQEVREQQDEEDQRRVDDFWDEALMDEEFVSQLPPDANRIKREETHDAPVAPPDYEELQNLEQEEQVEVDEERASSHEEEEEAETEIEEDSNIGPPDDIDSDALPLSEATRFDMPYISQPHPHLLRYGSSSSPEENSLPENVPASNTSTTNTSERRKNGLVLNNVNTRKGKSSIGGPSKPLVFRVIHKTTEDEDDGSICTQVCTAAVGYRTDDHSEESTEIEEQNNLDHNPINYCIPDTQLTPGNNSDDLVEVNNDRLSSQYTNNNKSRGKRSGSSSITEEKVDVQPKKVKVNSISTTLHTKNKQANTTKNGSYNVNRNNNPNEAGWDSDEEEALDYAFLDEINSSY